jgi:hypothetical protein
MGRPRSAKNRPTLAKLDPDEFCKLIGAALSDPPALYFCMPPDVRGRVLAMSYAAARQARGEIPASPTFAVQAWARGLTTPAIGPSAPLLVDTDRMPSTPLGWLSLVVLVLELRDALAENKPVRAVLLAAGSGRSILHCRGVLGGARELEASKARAWLQKVTGGHW